MNTNTTGADRMREEFDSFMVWAKDHLGQGYSLEWDEGFVNPVTRWAFIAWKAAKQMDTNTEPRKTLLTEEAIEAGKEELQKYSMFSSSETGSDAVKRIFHAMEAQLPSFVPATPAAQTDDLAFQYASSLATALFQKHFASDPDYTSGRVKWGLCDSTAGILTQIDNMVSALVKPAAQAEEAGWQPIEMVPYGGCPVLLWNEKAAAINPARSYRIGNTLLENTSSCTHWMPLPKPPATQADPTDKSA